MLSHPFKQLLRSGSIAEKLRRINLLTTGSAFLVAILLLTTYDYLNLSSELLEDSQVKAQLIGRNSASALEFEDAKAAGEVLNSLEADAQVLHAALWDQAGQRLAVYRSAAQSADEFITHSSHGHELGLAVLDVAQPVSADGKPIGTIALRLDLSQLYQRLVWHALAFALVILIALALSHRLLSRLNRTITAPASSLANVMAMVSRRGDYAARVPIESSDEIGDLAKGFNAMLEEIEDRNRLRAAHRHALEAEMESRTGELRKARDLAEAKGFEMVCSVAHDLPVAVSGDPVRVRQILTNLVNNAIKFTSRGDVVLRVRLLDENPQQARFRFEVQDSGIGISEKAQTRLFSAFVQADSSTTRRFGGSGLGQAIAKRLVDQHRRWSPRSHRSGWAGGCWLPRITRSISRSQAPCSNRSGSPGAWPITARLRSIACCTSLSISF